VRLNLLEDEALERSLNSNLQRVSWRNIAITLIEEFLAAFVPVRLLAFLHYSRVAVLDRDSSAA